MHMRVSRTYMHMHVRMYACTYDMHMHVRMYVYAYVYACMHPHHADAKLPYPAVS